MTSPATSADCPRPGTAPAAPLARRLAAPLLVGAGAAGAVLLAQAVFDPFRQDVPLCLVYHLTGLYCPGCGMTRGVHALLEGDVMLALRNNALLALLIPLAVISWARWVVRAARPGAMRALRMPRPFVIAAAVLLAVLFAVLRNLPWFAVLAPTSLVGA